MWQHNCNKIWKRFINIMCNIQLIKIRGELYNLQFNSLYLVLSIFTLIPVTLLATTKASVSEISLYSFFNVNGNVQLLYCWKRGTLPNVQEVGGIPRLVWMGP
jgi:hypothetical protein